MARARPCGFQPVISATFYAGANAMETAARHCHIAPLCPDPELPLWKSLG